MKQKRMVALVIAVVCLFGLMAGMLSGCRSTKLLQVSFDMNWKEAASEPESIKVKTGATYGQLPKIPEGVREGYSFGGWYLDADCEGEEVTADTVVTAEKDHKLYAKWIGDKITVSFDLQGGSINGVSNVEDVVVTVGNVYSMMAIPDDPEWDNHSFIGWYYDPEGIEGPVLSSTRVEKTEDHTLYAVWQEYQLFYDFENGTGLDIFTAAGNVQYGIEHYNGSDQLNISNPGTDKPDGSTLQMWIPLKTGTRVSMDLTFAGQLPSEDARMYMFCYGLNDSGVAITEGLLDINESETHRRWYHGNGYRAMQKNGVWYYGDEGNWTEGNTCRFEMIVMEDCAGLSMQFCLGSGLEPAQFAANDIYIDNIEFTPNYYRVLKDGMMGESPYGATQNGIYFTMKDNGVPYGDWDVYYSATTANNVKLIRNGKVYSVAEVGCDNICKFDATSYYLRLEEYTIGAAAPITTKDMFIVEGDFKHGNSVLSIKKAYIYHNGTAWVIVDQLPKGLAPASEKASPYPDPYYGILRSHEAGAAEGGIHFRLSDNGLPFGNWDVYYDATSADNVKVIRNGKVYRAAQIGCDNICKFSKDEYFLRLENYTIGSFAPFTTKDIFIIEGDFVYEDSTLSINKTYIYYDGEAWVFTTKLPEALAPESEEPVSPAELPEGVLGAGLGATDTGIYFTMKDNGLPLGDWDVYYDATTTDNVKIIRDGKVYAVAETGCDNISKFSKNDYYLRLESYTIGSFAPFTTKDIFIVEGDFTYEDSTLTIKKTYIYHDGVAWVFTTELPTELAPKSEEVTIPDDPFAGILRPHEAGASEGGIHFRLSDNGLPYDKDWHVYYDATSADNIKVIRNGKVYRAAQIGCDNICKFSKDEYYLRLESYTIGSYAPFSTADIFIVEGDFTYEDATLSINKTYIYHDGTSWVFATELPEALKPETEEPVAPELSNDGVMSSSPNGATENGIYFTMKDNGLAYGDWDVYYGATDADDIKIIRDGKVYAVAEVGCDNICKFSATDYYLRLESYTIGSYAPFSNTDIFIVEGDFTHEDATLTINKTYIYYDGEAWVFATELPEALKPETEEVAPDPLTGVLRPHEAGAAEGGIYFRLSDNGLPFGDWDVYYDATKADNIKLVREGKVYAAAQVGCDNICKFSKDEYYLKLESHTIGGYAPYSTADIFIVEGDFTYEDATLTIVKTYIYHDGTAWVFATELPEELKPETEEPTVPGEPTDGMMGSSIIGASSTGIYFTMKDNGLPYGDWDVYYDATSADNVKIIRGGVTYSAAKVGCDNICKFSATDYYLRLEDYTIGTYAPFSNQDIFIVEGDFTNEESVLSIVKTYIYHDGTAWVFATELPEELQPDSEWSFTFETGSVATDIFKLRDSDLNMTVEEFGGSKQLKLQPTDTTGNYWLWMDMDLTAGTVIELDVTFARKLGVMSLYMYGAKDNGDPITEGTVSNTVPQKWFDGQGVDADFTESNTNTQKVTFTVYEDCYGIAFMLGYGNKKPNVIYLDNIALKDGSGNGPELGNEAGVLSAHNGGGSGTGFHATGAQNDAPYDWAAEYAPSSKECIQIIRNGDTIYRENTSAGAIVKFDVDGYYVKFDTWIDGANYPLQAGDIIIIEGVFVGTGNYAAAEGVELKIDKTYVVYDGESFVFSATEPT